MKFKNLKIGIRIGTGFAVVLGLLMLVIALGLGYLSRLNEAIKIVTNDRYAKIVRVNNIYEEVNSIALVMRDTLLFTESLQLNKELDRIKKSKTIIDANFEALTKTVTSIKGSEILKAAISARAAYGESQELFITLHDAGKLEEAKALLMNRLRIQQQNYMTSLKRLIAFQTSLMDDSVKSQQEEYAAARQALLELGAVGVVLGGLIAWLIARGITRPISDAVNVAKTVASGDLSRKIEASTKDETGMLLNSLKMMNNNLVSIVAEVRLGTDAVATASSQIASGNLDLSSRTEEQASSLEETASSMEELTATVKQNADNAQQANQLAISASGVAQKGGTVVSQVVEMMED